MAIHCLATITIPVNNRETDYCPLPSGPAKLEGLSLETVTFVPASGCNLPILSLQAAAQGSTAVQIPCPKDATISPLQCPFKLYTAYWGPILPSTVGLSLSHSSLSMKGIMVHIGVIDKDYVGEITVMIPGPSDWQFKTRGKKMELLLLPYIATV